MRWNVLEMPIRFRPNALVSAFIQSLLIHGALSVAVLWLLMSPSASWIHGTASKVRGKGGWIEAQILKHPSARSRQSHRSTPPATKAAATVTAAAKLVPGSQGLAPSAAALPSAPPAALSSAEHLTAQGRESGIAADAATLALATDSMALSLLRQQYLAELQARIEQRKVYPESARLLGQHGRVELQMSIRPDGTVGEVKILKPSPYERLNQAALRLLEGIGPLKPLPFLPHPGPDASWAIQVAVIYENN